VQRGFDQQSSWIWTTLNADRYYKFVEVYTERVSESGDFATHLNDVFFFFPEGGTFAFNVLNY
jgi:hypothetical protein